LKKNRSIFLIALLVSGLVLSCASYSTLPTYRAFPVYIPCGPELKISDPFSKYERNRLGNIDDMAYSYTYHKIIFRSDSLQKEEIRNFTSTLSNYIVRTVFPKIATLSPEKFKSMSYFDYYKATRTLYPSYTANELSSSAVQNLVVPSQFSKQLFIDLSTYIRDGNSFNNYLHIYIFDTRKNAVLYYDFLKYSCDIRDTTAYTTSLKYALKKISKDIN